MAQTIYPITDDSLLNSTDEYFISWGRNYLLCKKYGLGKDYDRNTTFLIGKMGEILCQNYCTLLNNKGELQEKLNLLIQKNGL